MALTPWRLHTTAQRLGSGGRSGTDSRLRVHLGSQRGASNGAPLTANNSAAWRDITRHPGLWWHRSITAATDDYIASVKISPTVAADMATTVIQPRMFMDRVLTQRPMMRVLFVAHMISSIRKGVDTPCTIPA